MAQRIELPFIPVGIPGAQAPYPFDHLGVGDVLAVPKGRCNRESIYLSVIRFQRKRPGRLFMVSGRKNCFPGDADYIDEPTFWIIKRIQ